MSSPKRLKKTKRLFGLYYSYTRDTSLCHQNGSLSGTVLWSAVLDIVLSLTCPLEVLIVPLLTQLPCRAPYPHLFISQSVHTYILQVCICCCGFSFYLYLTRLLFQMFYMCHLTQHLFTAFQSHKRSVGLQNEHIAGLGKLPVNLMMYMGNYRVLEVNILQEPVLPHSSKHLSRKTNK